MVQRSGEWFWKSYQDTDCNSSQQVKGSLSESPIPRNRFAHKADCVIKENIYLPPLLPVPILKVFTKYGPLVFIYFYDTLNIPWISSINTKTFNIISNFRGRYCNLRRLQRISLRELMSLKLWPVSSKREGGGEQATGNNKQEIDLLLFCSRTDKQRWNSDKRGKGWIVSSCI